MKVRREVEVKVRWRGQRVRVVRAVVRLSRSRVEVMRVRGIRGCSMVTGLDCVMQLLWL